MSVGTKVLIGVGGVVLAWWLLPAWLVLLVLIGLPVAGYLLLDESQRRRLTGRSRRRPLDH